jgi:hypothetical protein
MTVDGANSAIKASALVVGGVYVYRRLTEGTAEELKASTQIAPLGNFLLGWGVVFLTLSLLAPAAPGTAGHMALLLMLASLLANGIQVSKDLQAGLKKPLAEREKLLHPNRRRGAGRRGGTVAPQPTYTERSA